jgi:hypothetical protein
MSKKKVKRKAARKSALEKECDRALTEQIRRLLALPMNKRTHFLRVRHPGGGSHLSGSAISRSKMLQFNALHR